MNDTGARRLVASGAAMFAALAAGCRGGNTAPANTPPTGPAAQPTVAYAGSAPPPGYPGSPAPPGYPGTYAPPPAAGSPQQPGATAMPPPYAQQPPAGAASPAPMPPAAPTAQAPMVPQPAPTASAAAAPTAPLAPTDPNSLQSILTGIQGALQGILVAPGSLPVDLTEAGLKAQAVRLAPGMQPEGAELKQTLAEGQHAVMMVTLQAGKCYTLLGFSPPGAVRDLDLNLLGPPFYVTLAGQDMTHDNAPSIGAAPNPMCPIVAFPLQYKLDVFAKSGAGQVAVQLYSKAKP